uniref:Uncharacterized protein n=1 Tax=Solanum lycopersicum TaxID=4081 RepID=A0A3Q7IEN2_SOLLC
MSRSLASPSLSQVPLSPFSSIPSSHTLPLRKPTTPIGSNPQYSTQTAYDRGAVSPRLLQPRLQQTSHWNLQGTRRDMLERHLCGGVGRVSNAVLHRAGEERRGQPLDIKPNYKFVMSPAMQMHSFQNPVINNDGILRNSHLDFITIEFDSVRFRH